MYYMSIYYEHVVHHFVLLFSCCSSFESIYLKYLSNHLLFQNTHGEKSSPQV